MLPVGGLLHSPKRNYAVALGGPPPGGSRSKQGPPGPTLSLPLQIPLQPDKRAAHKLADHNHTLTNATTLLIESDPGRDIYRSIHYDLHGNVLLFSARYLYFGRGHGSELLT